MPDRACPPFLARHALASAALAAAALLAGCMASAPVAPSTVAEPASAPLRSGGDIAAARRCLDQLLLDSGARDLTLALDESVEAQARERLAATLADLAPRSRAVRIVDARATVPSQYVLRAALRGSDSAAPALELSLLDRRDMSVVPGTASRQVSRRGADGSQQLQKFGTRIDVAPGGDALRPLLDLGAIELVGRLARVPYWTCFGAAPTEAGVAAEIQDWYDTLAARPTELIGYFQQALRQRRVYDGPVDGSVNPALKEAVVRAREALGLSREPKLSLDFFQAWLGAEPAQLEARLAPRPATAVPMPAPLTATTAPLPPKAPETAAPLALRLTTSADTQRFAKGEPVQLTLRASRDAHVYCFHQDEHRRITRFFPNRFQPDSRLSAGAALRLPGAMRFEIVMNGHGVPEAVACFATERDVLDRLPAALGASDFAPLPVAGFEPLRTAFAQAAGGQLVQESLQIRPR